MAGITEDEEGEEMVLLEDEEEDEEEEGKELDKEQVENGGDHERTMAAHQDDDDASAGDGTLSSQPCASASKSIESMLATATAKKEEGNAHFSNHKYPQAMASYEQGLAALVLPTTTTTPPSPNDQQEAIKAVLVSLRSNLAQTCLKLKQFQEAEHHCTIVLEELDDTVAKVWYRRALAREHMGQLLLAAEDLKRSVRLLQAQNQDAQMTKTAWQALDRVYHQLLQERQPTTTTTTLQPDATATAPVTNSTTTTSTVNGMNGHAHHHQNNSNDDVDNKDKNNNNSTPPQPLPEIEGVQAAATTATTTRPESTIAARRVSPDPVVTRPTREEQQQTVTKLLISRSVALSKKNSTQPTAGQPGEALFLIDFNWWAQWCRHVNLFGNDPVKIERILALLPHGAVLPPLMKDTTTNNNSKDKDKNKANDSSNNSSSKKAYAAAAAPPADDDTSMESSDSEDQDQDRLDDRPPGPIDNSNLLFSTLLVVPKAGNVGQQQQQQQQLVTSSTRTKFYQQWYRHLYHQQPSSATAVSHDTDSKECNQDTENSTFSTAAASTATNAAATTNSSSVALRPNLVRGFHYEILPREVYCALKSWYKELTPTICRRTVLRNNSSNRLAIDLYPTVTATTKTATTKAPTSRHKCAACRSRSATKRCTRCQAVWYCDRSCQEAHWVFHKVLCGKIAKSKTGNINGNALPPAAEGRVGLNNMGNTCFMASALQSLSHATPLTRHFLSNQFQKDVNPQNPLGTGGKLAHAYSTVVKELWWASGGASTSPTALKRAIALFAPRFAGCLQHDAQEFLAYLLDGLHEDLNRVRKAPYVEMPDFDNIHNNARTRVAASQAWECHLKRNDSLVMDTFYGQFKSTCVCPACARVSVSFDAFNHVSLEIPTPLHQSTLWLSLLLFSNPKSDKQPATAVRYAFSFRRNDLVADLRHALSQLSGIPTTHLVICEVKDGAIVEILHDNNPLSSIRQDEFLAAYEVDPYTTTSIHIICSNSLMEALDPGGAANSTPKTLRDSFGFPMLTSCDANLSCRQLWDHIWARVRHFVVPLTENGDEEEFDTDLEEAYRHMLELRVTDGESKSTAVFPASPEGQNVEDEEPPRTPYVPRTLDESISKYFGEDCTTRFLFVCLEWTESIETPQEFLKPVTASSTPNGNTNNKKKKKTKKNNNSNKVKNIPKTLRVDEKRFLTHVDHPSYAECVIKKREMDGIRGVSLDQCFETFTRPERLDENNMWYCSSCKEHVRALKTMELWRLPNVLVVHLKRFEFRQGFRRDKLATFVDFPLEGLDMSKHCAQWKIDGSLPEQLHVNDTIPAVYDLFAVVNHYGRMGFGHYTAFARKWDEEELSTDWALFDDSSVRSIGDGKGGNGVDQVVSSAAYVLFYRRRAFN